MLSGDSQVRQDGHRRDPTNGLFPLDEQYLRKKWTDGENQQDTKDVSKWTTSFCSMRTRATI